MTVVKNLKLQLNVSYCSSLVVRFAVNFMNYAYPFYSFIMNYFLFKLQSLVFITLNTYNFIIIHKHFFLNEITILLQKLLA